MRVSSQLLATLAGSFSLAYAPALSAAAPGCAEISADVQKAIAADPARMLMVVEDALVINESCACEIVQSAIQAANADEAMVQQIVQTAIAVAPKMTAVITECAGMTGEGSVLPVVAVSGKDGKGGKSVIPAAEPYVPAEPVSGGSDFYAIPSSIRGVYLMAPGGVGVIEQPVEVPDTPDSERRRRKIPVSPSYASHH